MKLLALGVGLYFFFTGNVPMGLVFFGTAWAVAGK
jgi:hypothetical protein